MSKDDNKEYRGPGKFTAAVGRGTVESTAIGLATLPIDLAVAGNIMSKGLTSKNLAVIGATSAVGLAGLAHGAYKGWTNAEKAKQDHDDLQSQVSGFKQKEEIRRDINDSVKTR